MSVIFIILALISDGEDEIKYLCWAILLGLGGRF